MSASDPTPTSAAAPAPRRDRLPRPTDRLPLGDGLAVSPVALGIVGEPATVSAAYDAGVNFFFLTTDMHWPLYDALRAGLGDLLAARPGVRDHIVVAGVTYVTRPSFCYAPFEELADAVPGLGRLDVLVAGGASAPDFFARLPVFERHRAARHTGCRAIGASFHDRAAARLAVRHELVDVAFIRYNALHDGARADLLPALAAPPRPRTRLFNFKSTMGWVPPARFDALGVSPDHWRPRVEDHYRLVLSRPEIDGVLVALQDPAQLDALTRALAEPPLDDDEQDHLVTLAQLAAGRADWADAGGGGGGGGGGSGATTSIPKNH